MQVIATIHHISSGKVDGSVYTNGWPEFSSVVCQYKGTFSQWVCMKFYSRAITVTDLVAWHRIFNDIF